MESISYSLSQIVVFFLDTAEHLAEGVEIILSFISFPLAFSYFLPELIGSAFAAVVAIGIIKFIIGR